MTTHNVKYDYNPLTRGQERGILWSRKDGDENVKYNETTNGRTDEKEKYKRFNSSYANTQYDISRKAW